MDDATNITADASNTIFGEAGEEIKNSELGRREPVSGQMGNVAAREPYDKGNLETQGHDTALTYGAADSKDSKDSKATNGAAAEQAGASATRKKFLYKPTFPVGHAENGSTDYTSSARRATALDTDSRNLSEQKSPIVQGVGEPERMSGSGTGEQHGITYDESNVEAKWPSDSGPAFPIREGGRPRPRPRQSLGSRSIGRLGQVRYGSLLGEAYLKQCERDALAPLSKNEQARRHAAQAYAADHERDLETMYTNISIVKQKKLRLRGRIKAMFSNQ